MNPGPRRRLLRYNSLLPYPNIQNVRYKQNSDFEKKKKKPLKRKGKRKREYTEMSKCTFKRSKNKEET